MEEKITRREMILEAALTLFAEKGYDGVGIDEIGRAVGMKGPALYYYFKGKEALLDGIIETIETYYAHGIGNENDMPETMEEFCAVTMKRVRFTICDPKIRSTRKLMAKEQFRNEKIRTLTTAHQLTRVQELNAACIARLIENGELSSDDIEMMAFEYTAPVSLLIQIADREPEREAEIFEMIQRHIEHFASIYGNNRGKENGKQN